MLIALSILMLLAGPLFGAIAYMLIARTTDRDMALPREDQDTLRDVLVRTYLLAGAGLAGLTAMVMIVSGVVIPVIMILEGTKP